MRLTPLFAHNVTCHSLAKFGTLEDKTYEIVMTLENQWCKYQHTNKVKSYLFILSKLKAKKYDTVMIWKVQ